MEVMLLFIVVYFKLFIKVRIKARRRMQKLKPETQFKKIQ